MALALVSLETLEVLPVLLLFVGGMIDAVLVEEKER